MPTSLPPIPENAIPLRRTFFRNVRKALEATAASRDAQPLVRILDQMDRWVRRAHTTGVVDPRLDWLAWTCGDMISSQPSSTKPLPQILEAPFVPVAIKARALELTRTIEALNPYWVEVDNRRYSYGSIQPETWLLAANVPGIDAFVRERETVEGLQGRPLEHPDRPGRFDAGWAHAWRNVLTTNVDWVQNLLQDRTVTAQQVYNDVTRSAHERALFRAAMQHGWGTPEVLDTWPGHVPNAKRHVAETRLQVIPIAPGVAGSLADLLAACEPIDGVLEEWKAMHPHNWSTWVSPTTGTTLWRSLLLNEDPAILASWLHQDPSAIDRPIPNGVWSPDQDGLGNRRRTFAGSTWNERDLEAALAVLDNPVEKARLNAWWDDPAPSLRSTVWALTQHLFPAATPFLERREWSVLAAVIEGIDLRAEVDAQRVVLGMTESPVVRARSRL